MLDENILLEAVILVDTILAALILAYMILFGHGLPNTINKNLF
jgi:hypothetical protein